jgi:hypothetical protein
MAQYFETLQEHSEAAYQLGFPYLSQENDWHVISSGVSQIFYTPSGEKKSVIKGESTFPASPEKSIENISKNIFEWARKTGHTNIKTELAFQYDDGSYIGKELINLPGIGDITFHKYVKLRHNDDGSIMLVITSAKVPGYECTRNSSFEIIHVAPFDQGSKVKMVTEVNFGDEDSDKRLMAANFIKVFIELVNAELQ